MLQVIIDWFLYNLLNLDSTVKVTQSINFFLYDSVKILLLLIILIAVVGFLRTYLPQKKVKQWLGKKFPLLSNIFASSFGAITPFCSCSSIPIFLGFLEAGVPLGVAFSFLITSPLVNEYLVVLMLGFFGWKITLAYVLSGITIGVVGGFILGKLKLEKHLEKDLIASRKQLKEIIYSNLKERFRFGINEALSITKKIWLWVLLGVGFGAIISLLVMLSIFKKWKKLGDNLYLESTGIFVNAILLAFLGIVTPSDEMKMVFGYSFWAYLILCIGGVISLIIIFFFATSEQYASTKKKPCQHQILDGEKIIYQVNGFDGFGPSGKLIITPERIVIFKRDNWTGNPYSHSIHYEKILYFKKPGKIFANRIKINYIGEHGKVKKVTFTPWLDNSIKRNRQEVRDIIEYINKKVNQGDVSKEIGVISKSKKKKIFR